MKKKLGLWFNSILFFIIVLAMYGFKSYIKSKPSDKIRWSKNRKLTWGDFIEDMNNTSIYNAASVLSIEPIYDIKYDTCIEFRIETYFDRNKSWVKIKKDNILAHEQGHFDLYEIFTRAMKQRIAQKIAKFNVHDYNDVDNAVDQALNIIEGVKNELSYMDQLYDKETNHSRDTFQQKNGFRK